MSEAVEYKPPPAPPAGAPGAVTGGRAWEQVQTMLVAGETVVAFALQHRLYALLHRRHVGVATTGRFIFVKRPLLGGYLPYDVRWQDLTEVKITVGMFSAAVTLSYSANMSATAAGEGLPQTLRVSGLRIEAAQALYRECQAREQAWREKRRVRTIEEMRAAAGGVQIATGVYPQGGAAGDPQLVTAQVRPSDPGEDPAARLAKAKAMLDQGLLSDAEYEAIKAKVLGAL